MTSEFSEVQTTSIEGLRLITLDVHSDSRGWFKENWHKRRLDSIGIEGFRPVQNNIALNQKRGVTRGIHAEPWDKLVSVAKGRVFGAWVDLRHGPSFGTVFTCEVDASLAVFVPKGVANAYQVLEDETVYSYLVTAHWSAEAEYKFVNLYDPNLNIPWPIDQEDSIISEKDLTHPKFSEVVPFEAGQVIIIGANGQLGRALGEVFPNAVKLSRQEFKLGVDSLESICELENVEVIINAAAYTAVDKAETKDGFDEAWRTNVVGLMGLAEICIEKSITLVHFSSDYVFSGDEIEPYDEDALTSPHSNYGVSKAAGDLLLRAVPRLYLFRTSWVFGDGHNFVNTMRKKALNDEPARVICDQEGRLTHTLDIAKAVALVVESKAPFGTYNCTGSGPKSTWYDIASLVYERMGKSTELVTPISSEEFTLERQLKGEVTARRPHNSQLNLGKIELIGCQMRDWRDALQKYLDELSDSED